MDLEGVASAGFTSLDCSSSSFLTLKTRTTTREEKEAVKNTHGVYMNTEKKKSLSK